MADVITPPRVEIRATMKLLYSHRAAKVREKSRPKLPKVNGKEQKSYVLRNRYRQHDDEGSHSTDSNNCHRQVSQDFLDLLSWLVTYPRLGPAPRARTHFFAGHFH